MLNDAAFRGYMGANTIAGAPLTLVSLPPLLNKSTPEHTNPIRDLDLLSLPNFFNHSGNCVNGVMAASAVIGLTFLFGDRRKDDNDTVVIKGSIAAALLAAGVNVAYESGVLPEPFKAGADMQDAAYGAGAGLIFSMTFCALTLRARKRRNRMTVCS